MKILNYAVTTFVALLISVSAHAQQYSKITYVHSDPDGTAFAATNEQGNVEWKIEHFPFGREFENTSQDRKSDISFAGKPYDEEIGLSYFGGRWYDPDAGRFTGIDPMPVQANDYEAFNRYSYAFNNPYKYVDPDGNFAFLIPIAIFIAKEIAAEAASRATGGATDFLSVRRSGTKLIKGGISLLNKQKKNSLCFVEGTPVHTENGLKPIESIGIGDLILSKNDITGKPTYKTVTQTFINDDKEVLDIEFQNHGGTSETFGITQEHPVWVENKGWVEAGNLKVGDKVDRLDGQSSTVADIRHRPHTERTYNIEVEDYHTYFVGDSGLWVHNMCVGGAKKNGDNITVYRGVSAKHPALPEAKLGKSTPRGGHSNPERHNNFDTKSEFTSWTTDPKIAKTFANTEGPGGVVLKQSVNRSSLTRSPDVFKEKEVLRRGRTRGASVKKQ